MVAFQFVPTRFGVDPAPAPGVDRPFGELFALDITIDFSQPGTTEAEWTHQFGGLGDQGTAEISVVVNNGDICPDTVPPGCEFSTSDEFLFRYHLTPTDAGPVGSFFILDHGFFWQLSGFGDASGWHIGIGVDVPMGAAWIARWNRASSFSVPTALPRGALSGL